MFDVTTITLSPEQFKYILYVNNDFYLLDKLFDLDSSLIFFAIKMSKAKRWTAECDDDAVLAKAILTGIVTNNLQLFKDFFYPNLGGS